MRYLEMQDQKAVVAGALNWLPAVTTVIGATGGAIAAAMVDKPGYIGALIGGLLMGYSALIFTE